MNTIRIGKNNYISTARLKELMTTPPMSAKQHAEIARRRTRQRRMIEDARELKSRHKNYLEAW